MSNITILIPTSPIPSHPSTAILDETISNIRKYTDAKIIIMLDGVHESLAHRTEDYVKYFDNFARKSFDGEYGDCSVRMFEHHRHQVEMTKQVLKDVHTDLIMFCEHDTSPIGDIPFDEICSLLMSTDEINYLRFHINHKILDEHQYLMIDKEPLAWSDNVSITRTIQYSQRPHIAKTKWYKDMLWTYFPDGARCMIEDTMHSVVASKYHALGFDTFGLAIYTPEGNMLRSYHSDGRGEDEKIING